MKEEENVAGRVNTAKVGTLSSFTVLCEECKESLTAKGRTNDVSDE